MCLQGFFHQEATMSIMREIYVKYYEEYHRRNRGSSLQFSRKSELASRII